MLNKTMIVAVWLLSGFLSVQAQRQPCECADARDLLNRINEANAAIAEYETQIEIMLAQEKTAGSRLKSTPELYRKMQDRVQRAINFATDSNARKATAKTSELTCETSIEAPTECLRSVIDTHESYHRATCPARRGIGVELFLTDIAKEEITAYNAEINYILSLLSHLPKTCVPNSWFGTVVTKKTGTETNGTTTRTVNETGKWNLLFKTEATTFAMPNIPQVPGAEKAMLEAMAKIQAQMEKSGVSNPMGITDTYVYIKNVTKSKGAGTECCSTDAGVSPDIDLTETEFGNYHAPGKITIVYAPGRLNLSFDHDPVEGQVTEETSVISSPCPYDKDRKLEKEKNLRLDVPKLDTAAQSRTSADMETLKGSKTVSAGAFTISYEWNLRRFIK